MKRFLCLLVGLALVPLFAFADYENCPDVSGLSYLELMYMHGCVNRALWACEEWTKVEVPSGVYKIGDEIPAGRWTITPTASDDFYTIHYGTKLNRTETGIDSDSIVDSWNISSNYSDSMRHRLDITLEEGYYIDLGHKSTFAPYTGKPTPDFKFD